MRPPAPAHGPVQPPLREVDSADTAAGPAVPRDRAILIHLARTRVLSLDHLARLAFRGRHRSRLSRRIASLACDGWVTTWDEPRLSGGRPRFVLPTRRGLRWALAQIRQGADGLAHARLIDTMLRSDGRTPLRLAPGRTPPFWPHLQELHEVVTRLATAPELEVTWASTWHRPFPNGMYGVSLPQPDAILILTSDVRSRRLVFLEHDRGTESLRHFAHTKANHYRALAQRPGLLKDLTGFETFEVWVTVAAGDRTEKRIDDLRRIARANYAERLFRFSGSTVLTDMYKSGYLITE